MIIDLHDRLDEGLRRYISEIREYLPKFESEPIPGNSLFDLLSSVGQAPIH